MIIALDAIFLFLELGLYPSWYEFYLLIWKYYGSKVDNTWY